MGKQYTKHYQILTLFILFHQVAKIDITSARSLLYVPQGSAQDLVSFACKNTLYPDICFSSLSSDPRTKTACDLKTIAAIALDLSVTQSAKTEAYIDKLIKSHNSSRKVNHYTSLDDCQEEYSEAVDDLNHSVQAMNSGSYDSVNELVSGAMTDCQTCLDGAEEGVDSKNDMISSFVDKNQYFYKLCSNVLAILKLIG